MNTKTCEECGQKIGTISRDSGTRLLLKDLVDELIQAEDKEDFCNKIDDMFLFGAWANVSNQVDPLFLKDVRGLVYSLAEKAKTRYALPDEHHPDCNCRQCK